MLFFSSGSSIGGDSYWMAAAHIYTPLPFQPALGGFGDNFRTHFFFNAGNLMNMDFSELLFDTAVHILCVIVKKMFNEIIDKFLFW